MALQNILALYHGRKAHASALRKTEIRFASPDSFVSIPGYCDIGEARRNRTKERDVEMNEIPVKTALVGLGLYGGPFDAYTRGVPGLELVKVFDVRKEATERVSGQLNCPGASSYEEIIEDDEIGAVIVNTPNFAHCEQAVAAARHGKHAYVVKPMANTAAECRRMIDAARDAGTILFVDHPIRRTGANRKIKELLNAGAIGKVFAVEATVTSGWGQGLTPDQWRWYESKCPSGPLIQIGVHSLDTLIYFFGPIVAVSAMIRKYVTKAEIDDTAMNIYEFESGLTGFLHANYVTGVCHSSMHIYGTDGNIFSDPEGLTLRKRKCEPEKVATPDGNCVYETFVEFSGCIHGSARQEVTPESAMHVVAVVEAARLSSKAGREVRVGEVEKKA